MSDNAQPILLSTLAEGVLTLTLNRPRQRNALSGELLAALRAELRRCAQDSQVRVVVLAGAGPAFCAGHDLRELRSANAEQARALFTQCSDFMQSLVGCAVPVIAKVGGVATAAGCQLVASCDLAVASTQARFATPGVNIGLFCSTPAVALSRAVADKHALEMLLTGEAMDAARAERIGLINRVVPPERLDAEVAELAGSIAAQSRATLALGRRSFRQQRQLPLADAYTEATNAMVANLALADAVEGIDAFLDKRAPRWQDR